MVPAPDIEQITQLCVWWGLKCQWTGVFWRSQWKLLTLVYETIHGNTIQLEMHLANSQGRLSNLFRLTHKAIEVLISVTYIRRIWTICRIILLCRLVMAFGEIMLSETHTDSAVIFWLILIQTQQDEDAISRG
jgi:hypothetical protein